MQVRQRPFAPQAEARSLTATIAPMLLGAPDRRDVGTHVRGEVSARAGTGLVCERTGMLNAHMAFDSTVSRPWSAVAVLADCARLAATIAVDPPTDPAVCTRITACPSHRWRRP